MNAQDFAFWLQGFVELNPSDKIPTEAQWKLIKEHLALVFNKQTSTLEKLVKEVEEKQVKDKIVTVPYPGYPNPPSYVYPWWTDPNNPNRITCDTKYHTICARYDVNTTKTYCSDGGYVMGTGLATKPFICFTQQTPASDVLGNNNVFQSNTSSSCSLN